jgi:WD40 repeat protein
MIINYNQKYLKYKNKYLKLKNMIGGTLKEVETKGQINSISFNKNGHLAIGTNTNTQIYDNTYTSIKTLKKEKTTCPVNHVSYSDTHLVTSCDANAIVYDFGNNYNEIKVCEGKKKIIRMECAPTDNLILIYYDDGEIILWKPTELDFFGNIKYQKLKYPYENEKINSISWSHQNLNFVTCSTHKIIIWTITNSKINTTNDSILIKGNYKLVAFVPHKYSDSDYVALVYKNSSEIHFHRCSIFFWDDKNPKLILDTEHEIKKKDPPSQFDDEGIVLMVFHPTKKYLATYGTDKKVKIWNFEDSDKLSNFKNIKTSNFESEVSSIAFHDTDIAIGCKDGKVIIWQEFVPKKP